MGTRYGIFAVCITHLVVMAASAVAADVWLGPAANGTSTDIAGDSRDTRKVGFGGGVAVDVGFADRFSLAFQPSVVSRKAGMPGFTTGYRTNMRSFGPYVRSYYYVEAPILVKFKPFRQGYYVVAGANVGYLVADYDAVKDTTSHLGLVGGMGIEIPLGRRARVFVEGQYDHAVTKVYTPQYGDSYWFKTYIVRVGFLFATKPKPGSGEAQGKPSE